MRSTNCYTAVIASVFAATAMFMGVSSLSAQELFLQNPSAVGGGTGTQLNSIRAQSIGTGYRIDSLNQRTLNQSRAQPVRAAGVNTSTINSSITGPGSRPNSKPFANSRSRSTVSPYLNLFNEGFNASADNYNTLVRPQLNQQRMNQQMQQQSQALNRRVQSISAQPAFNPQGSQNMMATGHRTLYGYKSHFYPSSR